jgi:hypothetical protein
VQCESALLVLFALGVYVGLPALMVWGWVRWFRRRQLRTLPSILSLIGFTLATASGLLSSFLGDVRARDWWVPFLRSTPAENLPLGRVALAFRPRVRHRRSMATWAGALACSCLFPGDSPVLVRVGDGGIVFPLSADLLGIPLA